MKQKKIKIKTPAKINLSLEIIDKFPNGFHSISSVMQTVSLFDYLTFSLSETGEENQIILTGNSPKIPYDEKNIIYKVLKLYLDEIKANGIKIEVDIEKNIPTEAGLAGGSTNAAGALIAVNNLFNDLLPMEKIHTIAAQVGSDLNFCLTGGACLLSSRGEIVEEKLPFQEFDILILKPKNISVSTKLCYQNFASQFFEKKNPFYSSKICDLFKNDFNLQELGNLFYNDLEKPAIVMHPEIQQIKNKLINAGCINALMSGSGSSVFGILPKEIDIDFDEKDFEIFHVKSTNNPPQIV